MHPNNSLHRLRFQGTHLPTVLLITCAASRVGSPDAVPAVICSLVSITSVDAIQTSMWVRNPAGRWRFLRSMPITPPHQAARSSRNKVVSSWLGSNEAINGVTKFIGNSFSAHSYAQS